MDRRPASDAFTPSSRSRDPSWSVSLPRALGWLSIGLGAAALGTPRLVARMIGADGHQAVLQLVGLREIAAGLGILSGHHAAGVRSRVAGDVIDLALLGTAMYAATDERLGRLAAATAVVAGITAVDFATSRRLDEIEADSDPAQISASFADLAPHAS